MKQWNAELLGDMTIRFNDPTVLFTTGSSDLKPKFKEILGEFFPRYVALITSDKYRSAIKEVRIEGHTSAVWLGQSDPKTAYFLNMGLSQARTRSALEYVLRLPNVERDQQWLIEHVTANGLSSSKPISKDEKTEQAQLTNQRVEFRIVTNASDRMDQIARELKAEKP